MRSAWGPYVWGRLVEEFLEAPRFQSHSQSEILYLPWEHIGTLVVNVDNTHALFQGLEGLVGV
jgi:hypothetical protein